MTTRTEFNFLIKNWFWLSFMQVMKTIFIWGCLMALFIEPCISDMYMHAPAGSNNRLNGNQDNVRNANRLFDSQVDYHYKLDFYCGNLIEGYSHKIFCYPLPSPWWKWLTNTEENPGLARSIDLTKRFLFLNKVFFIWLKRDKPENVNLQKAYPSSFFFRLPSFQELSPWETIIFMFMAI